MVRQFLLLASAVLLGACASDEVSTFGLAVEGVASTGERASVCAPEGNSDGFASIRLDHDAALPDLWVEAQQDFSEDAAYVVRVYVAKAYEGDTLVASELEVLEERRYDEAFGDEAGRDAIHVDFEGAAYEVVVSGLPSGTGTCPGVEDRPEPVR